ncbi:ribonuclease H-like domain-containing protein [Tanacetum coccineum]
MAFVSSNNSGSTNEAVNTAHGVFAVSTQVSAANSTNVDKLSDAVICAFFSSQPNNPQLANVQQLHLDDLEEMDLRWRMAMLTMRARRFLKNTGRKVTINELQENRNKESTRRSMPMEITTSNALILCEGLGDYDWSDQAEEGPTNFALMAYSSTSFNSEVSTDSNCSSSYLENVKILKEQNKQLLKDLRTSKLNTFTYKTEVAITELRRKLKLAQKQKDEIQLTVEKFENSSKNLNKLLDCQIVDKCKIGLGYNVVPPPYTGNFMPPKHDLSGLDEFVNEPIVNEPTVKKFVVETSEAKDSADKPKVVGKNNGGLIIEDWVSDSEDEDMAQAKKEKKTVKSSFAKIKFVKSKEQVKSPRKTTVKQGNQNRLNTHSPRENQRNWNNMMSQRLGSNFEMINKAHSTVRRPINNKTATKNSNFNQRVNTVSDKNVNTDRPKAVVNAVRPKALFNAVKGNQDKGVIDSRCSRHMTWNMSYLTEFEEINGGYVAFGVAERKNRTLIKAARTMLADSKLPITFWAEAVNTTCYVQNRVLVIKPHNKTPYELFLSRKPALGFMRPFGCPVTILNTIDHLGKFDGKVDEGFFVGYSINSKAFRVFNSRTRIVEENLHVQFSENTPNIAGSRPNWLFDIDALTKSMNYKPVVAGNQSNDNAGTKACNDAGDNEKKVTEEPRKEGGDSSNDQEKEDDSVNSTNNINTASDGNNTNNVNTISSTVNAVGIEVNAVGTKTSIELPDDPNMPELEDIVYSDDDDENVGAEAVMNNLNTFMPISPIPTTIIHKDHPFEQIIGDMNSAP